ncbi:DUF4244 domain-containing protein [Quadrisphaera sp. GCM10027208]|uniref:DUF4244 domain-containing protein n=1 Tax=Quadrisphaera sp. GCM10027208 TaxID=3273423 RepID=UPI00361EB456
MRSTVWQDDVSQDDVCQDDVPDDEVWDDEVWDDEVWGDDVPAAGVDQGRTGRDAGMATAEYAIATLAACGFAGLLVVILRGDEVRELLLGIVQRALTL